LVLRNFFLVFLNGQKIQTKLAWSAVLLEKAKFMATKNFFSASAVLIGYIIGVGMFSLPFIVNRSGILPFFALLLGLGLVQHFLHLIYANVILVSRDYHHLPGYAGEYIGPSAKKLAIVCKLVGNYGALLAYIIITGIFLHDLLAPIFGGSLFFYGSALFALEALIVFFGIGVLCRAELLMSLLLIMVVALIAIKGWPLVSAANFHLLDWKYSLLPYGAILFAVDGNGAIPAVIQLLNRNEQAIRRVVRIGFYLPAAIMIIFTLTVLGISGAGTSADALTGIRNSFGDGVIVLALIFGVLTIVTSFLGVSQATRDMLVWDYRLGPKKAWALAVFVPYIFYLLGLNDLIAVVSFAGAVAGGLSAMILIYIYARLSKTKGGLLIFKERPKEIFIIMFFLLFIGGLVYEMLNFFGWIK